MGVDVDARTRWWSAATSAASQARSRSAVPVGKCRSSHTAKSCARPALRTFVIRRVALVGDAAHAMTSDLGQGGCTSLEDAVELGRQLDDRPADPAPGLARYVRLRRPRTQAIARRSAI
jgi:2-polyprenyl-6-methoxyphenol hydroxylase-like FAD-dependent oxidoreductase